MKIQDFSRISDSNKKLEARRDAVERQRSDKKISDAKASLMGKIRDSESDDELIEVITTAADELPVSEVLTTVVEVLSPIVEKLNSEVADARRAVATMRKKLRDEQVRAKADARRFSRPVRKPKADSATARRLISRMKDDEITLEDLKQEAVELLDTFDPASVIEVIIEAIPPVVESVLASANETNE